MRIDRDMLVLDASVHDEGTIHSKKAYQWSSRRGPTRMREKAMFLEHQQSDEQPTLPTEVGRSLLSMVRRRASKFTKERGRLIHQICNACLDIVVRCVVVTEREEELHKTIKILPAILSKQSVEVLLNIVNERLPDQACIRSL